MSKKIVDLHVHSYYSDGSNSPLEIIEKAHENDVELLAIADHDTIDGSSELMNISQEHDINIISAVEIDTRHNNENFHILAYNIDFNDRIFIDYINGIRGIMDEYSVELITNMERDYNIINLNEYRNYIYDRSLGGWKALHYLLNKKLTNSLKEGISFYKDYTSGYPAYPTIADICERIKLANGFSVLAHPGELIDMDNIEIFEKEIRNIIGMGINGIECHYPSHKKEIVELCVKLCKENNLLITAGSDCHGVFGKTQIGEMGISIEQLNLTGIL